MRAADFQIFDHYVAWHRVCRNVGAADLDNAALFAGEIQIERRDGAIAVYHGQVAVLVSDSANGYRQRSSTLAADHPFLFVRRGFPVYKHRVTWLQRRPRHLGDRVQGRVRFYFVYCSVDAAGDRKYQQYRREKEKRLFHNKLLTTKSILGCKKLAGIFGRIYLNLTKTSARSNV